MRKLTIILFILILHGCDAIRVISVAARPNSSVAGEYYISPEIANDLNTPLPVFKKHIAREIKIFYLSSVKYKSAEYQPEFYTDEKLIKDASGNEMIPALVYAENVLKKSTLSQSLSNEAREESKKGNFRASVYKHKMSAAATKIDQSMSQAQAAVDMFSAALGVLEAVIKNNAKQSREAHAKIITNYIKNTLGVIGNSAPEGTVLHVYYQQNVDSGGFSPVLMKTYENIILSLVRDGKEINASADDVLFYLIEGEFNDKWTPPVHFKHHHYIKAETKHNQLAAELSFRYVMVARALKELDESIHN